MRRGFRAQAHGLASVASAVALSALLATSAYSASITELAGKLTIVDEQEVLLERIVENVCFYDAGIEMEIARKSAMHALEEFEILNARLDSAVRDLDETSKAKGRLLRAEERIKDQWRLFKVHVEQELKPHDASNSMLSLIVGEEEQMVNALIRMARTVKKFEQQEKKRQGDKSIGAKVGHFTPAFVAERMVKETCVLAIYPNSGEDRIKLAEAVEIFSKLSDDPEAVGSPQVREIMLEMREELPHILSVAQGGTPDDGLLERLFKIAHRWEAAAAHES
ncbi:MAG: hypothetical protein AAF913_14935 [Pseudomonadota bacterium]